MSPLPMIREHCRTYVCTLLVAFCDIGIPHENRIDFMICLTSCAISFAFDWDLLSEMCILIPYRSPFVVAPSRSFPTSCDSISSMYTKGKTAGVSLRPTVEKLLLPILYFFFNFSEKSFLILVKIMLCRRFTHSALI